MLSKNDKVAFRDWLSLGEDLWVFFFSLPVCQIPLGPFIDDNCFKALI